MEKLRKFLGLCSHNWEILQEEELFRNRRKDCGWYSEDEWVRVGTKYILKCKNCGDIKMKKMI